MANDDKWTFLHVNDSHMGTPRSYRYRPAVNRRWAAIKRQMSAIDADLLLHGGDLTRDGDTHEYEYQMAREDLDTLPFPTFVIPGNMDVGNKRVSTAGPMDDRDHRDIGLNTPRLGLFSSYFGPIHWTFMHRGVRFTGMHAAVAGSGLPHEERMWRMLERLPELPRARHHVAVMHYWPFMEHPDEPAWDMTKEEEYINWYFSIDPPHRHRLLGLFKAAGVEILFCGHVHTGRPVQVVDGLRLYRTSAGGNTAQLQERWPDAETRQGFHRCDVSAKGIDVTYVPGEDQCEEFDAYGPMGHPKVEERRYSRIRNNKDKHAMTKATIDYREHDQQIWEEELEEFVPDRVFDAHCHLFQRADFRELSVFAKGRKDADVATLREWGKVLYPGRTHSFLLLGTPIVGIDVDAHVRTVTAELKDEPDIRHFRVVTPDCKLDKIEQDLKTPGFMGLKPYRTFSTTGDIAQCRIHDFLLHEQMELANHKGLWVTMHLSKHHGCADEENLADLEEFTNRRYPNIKWILAHCARSFTYWPIRQAIERLRDMPNIHYDLSAVTDMRPHLTLFSKENTSRLFYGSDAVAAAYFHGQYPALGRAWQYLETDKSDIQFPHCDGRPILSVYEQLLSMKHAAEIAGLSHQQIEGIFWNNAITALGI